MRILAAPIATEILGSIGATTFKRTAAGAVAQVKRTHASRATALTRIRHAYFSTLNAAWHSLTGAQRAAWTSILVSWRSATQNKGPRRFLSAEALFISHNLPRLIFGLAQQTTAVTLAQTNASFHSPFTLAETTYFYIRFDLEPLLSGEYAFFDYSRPFSSSCAARKIPFAYHVLYTGPRSSLTAVYPPDQQPPKTSRWAQLRRHSSSRLTSAKCLVKIDHI